MTMTISNNFFDYFHHQYPFDRMIIAQAKTKSLELITNDSQVKKYFEQNP